MHARNATMTNDSEPAMSAMSHARSKIAPPRRPGGIVDRPALQRRLRAALFVHPLLLVAAPAGFGKTVALSQLAASLADANVWITADGDDDLPRFVACLADAFEPYDLPWRVAPDALHTLAGNRGGLRLVADELLNAFAGAERARVAVLLDDLHCIADPRIFELLDMLLHDLPAGWTIAAGSRVAPPLALPRLRAQRELAEFDAEDLRLSRDEVLAVAALSAAAAASSDAVQRVLERTGGWAAGVRICLSAGADSGARSARLANRHMFDYLTAEVVAQLPSDLHDFLLRCSVLPLWTATRCAAVSGDARATRWLDEAERRGLFVTPLDTEPPTLRPHDLFRDFLEDRLRQRLPHEWPALLARAAQTEPDAAQRVGLWLQAGGFERAEEALAQSAAALLAAGAHEQLLRLVEQFPEPLRETSPVLAYVRGLAALPRFAWRTLCRSMERAAAGFEAQGDARAVQARLLHVFGLLTAGRADQAQPHIARLRNVALDDDAAILLAAVQGMYEFFYGPGGPAIAEQYHRIVDLLERRSAPAAHWYRFVPTAYMTGGLPGLRTPMQRFANAALAVAGAGPSLLHASALLLQNWLLLWAGRLDEVEAQLDDLRDEERWHGRPTSLSTPLAMLEACCHALRARRDALRKTCDGLLDELRADGERRETREGYHCVFAGRLYASIDDWLGAREMLRAYEATPGCGPFAEVGAQLLRAEVALHDDRLSDALMLLRGAVGPAADKGYFGVDPAVRVRLAQACLRSGDAAAAWQALRPALQAVRASGDIGSLVLVGPSALNELAQARWDAQASSDTLGLLVEWAALASQLRDAAPSHTGAPAGCCAALTQRELEVLGCIAAGDSNKVIARALDLSPHTVKRHVARILTRLELSSRGQAAAWYRERSVR